MWVNFPIILMISVCPMKDYEVMKKKMNNIVLISFYIFFRVEKDFAESISMDLLPALT